MKIYLAGPDVFRPDAIEHGNKLKMMCAEYGHIGLYPMDNDPKISAYRDCIYTNNKKLLDSCDCVIANITPYHGPSADVGTVWEIGYAKALNKLVMAYTNDFTILRDKIEKIYSIVDNKTPDGMGFDDFGAIDNLMIVESLYDNQLKQYLIFSSLYECLKELK